MKKIFRITTKEGGYFSNRKEYNVFAKDISEAVLKITPLLDKGEDETIIEAEFLCNLEEDKDLKRLLKEMGEGE